jgi:serralysin
MFPMFGLSPATSAGFSLNLTASAAYGGSFVSVVLGVSAGVRFEDLRTVLPWLSKPITGTAGDDAVTLAAPLRLGLADLGGGRDTLTLSSAGPNEVAVINTERVIGGARNDAIVALSTRGVTLDGRGGNDTLVGGSGHDLLIGGPGQDLLIGGLGADRYLFRPGDSLPDQPDQIIGFTPGVDDLVFRGMLEGSFAYRGSAGFTAGGHSEARFSAGLLEVDANGDGVADTAIRLGNITGLSAGDFVWT